MRANELDYEQKINFIPGFYGQQCGVFSPSKTFHQIVDFVFEIFFLRANQHRVSQRQMTLCDECASRIVNEQDLRWEMTGARGLIQTVTVDVFVIVMIVMIVTVVVTVEVIVRLGWDF